MGMLSISEPTLTTILGTTGTLTGLCALLAPLPTFLAIIRRKSTEKYSCTPYLCTLLSSAIWAYYALPVVANDTSVLVINTFGLLIQFFYCTIFIRYSPDDEGRAFVYRIMSCLVALMAGIILLMEMGVPSYKITIIGIVGDVVSVSACASPVSSLIMMMRTRNVAFFPIFLCLMNFFNTFVWFLYGMVVEDLYITLPNVVGMTLSGLQVAVYFLYRSSKEEAMVPLLLDIEDMEEEEAHLLELDAMPYADPGLSSPAALQLQLQPLEPEHPQVRHWGREGHTRRA